MVFLSSTFIFAMVKWPEYKDSKTIIGKHLYYLTVAFVMYVFSFVFLILSKGFWAKAGASIAFSVFCINIYVELFLNPEKWSEWDMRLVPIVAVNLITALIIVEKIKQK